MTDPDALFDHPVTPVVVPRLSADQRRTTRQAAWIEASVHPLLATLNHPRPRLHPDAPRDASRDDPRGRPFTCGSCTHRGARGGTAGSYPKCWVGERATRGPATDVRAWWPACCDYEPKGS